MRAPCFHPTWRSRPSLAQPLAHRNLAPHPAPCPATGRLRQLARPSGRALAAPRARPSRPLPARRPSPSPRRCAGRGSARGGATPAKAGSSAQGWRGAGRPGALSVGRACLSCPGARRPGLPPVAAQTKKGEGEGEGTALSDEVMKPKVKGLLAELYNTKDVKEGLTCVRWAPGRARACQGQAEPPLCILGRWHASQPNVSRTASCWSDGLCWRAGCSRRRLCHLPIVRYRACPCASVLPLPFPWPAHPFKPPHPAPSFPSRELVEAGASVPSMLEFLLTASLEGKGTDWDMLGQLLRQCAEEKVLKVRDAPHMPLPLLCTPGKTGRHLECCARRGPRTWCSTKQRLPPVGAPCTCGMASATTNQHVFPSAPLPCSPPMWRRARGSCWTSWTTSRWMCPKRRCR